MKLNEEIKRTRKYRKDIEYFQHNGFDCIVRSVLDHLTKHYEKAFKKAEKLEKQNKKLKQEKKELREQLEESNNELIEWEKDFQCDHSTGVCYCELKNIVYRNNELLSKIKGLIWKGK